MNVIEKFGWEGKGLDDAAQAIIFLYERLESGDLDSALHQLSLEGLPSETTIDGKSIIIHYRDKSVVKITLDHYDRKGKRS